ncbi:MAG: tRNA pseudouridine(55) synthase TruB [Patescibacteria group bacterium]|jgi:tRNA pseudouridine55 synthase|nr:tRNA pseudouridine(55) synthase TruB [Patescibacteria group bacterium]
MSRRYNFKKGIFGIYKPSGPTSNDVVQMIRKGANGEKVGHAGTLDPLAEGILVVGIGREFTKNLNIELEKEKEYEAKVMLGAVSETDDGEGPIEEQEVLKKPIKREVSESLQTFVGHLRQMPPVYSAVKAGGKKAYEQARKGKKVQIGPRDVFVKKIELISYNYPIVKARIVTGPGVYIRSIARDLGENLGTGAYLSKLIRTRVGEFDLKNSHKLENFINLL